MAVPTLPISPGFAGFALDPGYGQFAPAVGGVTAKAGGGQSGATQITGNITRVATVATTGDSILLPTALAGMQFTVINAGANSLNVFPATGDAINALGANNAFAIAATKVVTFYCGTQGFWNTILTA